MRLPEERCAVVLDFAATSEHDLGRQVAQAGNRVVLHSDNKRVSTAVSTRPRKRPRAYQVAPVVDGA